MDGLVRLYIWGCPDVSNGRIGPRNKITVSHLFCSTMLAEIAHLYHDIHALNTCIHAKHYIFGTLFKLLKIDLLVANMLRTLCGTHKRFKWSFLVPNHFDVCSNRLTQIPQISLSASVHMEPFVAIFSYY